MKQRTAFLITSGLTAFLLVGVGMLVGAINTSNTATTVSATPVPEATQPAANVSAQSLVMPEVAQTPQGVTAPAGTPTADLLVTLAEREAQYRALIEEANRRLAQANQQLANLEQQLQEAQASQPAADTKAVTNVAQPAPVVGQPQPRVALMPQRALEIALIAVPGTVAQRMPEPVDFQGAVAYEVLLNTGAVYVDANSGVILYNGAVAQAAQPAYHYDDDDDDHDEDDDDHEEHEKKEKHKHKD